VNGEPMKYDDDRLTYQDYLDLPENGNRYEIISGELHNAPAPLIRHQEVLMNLGRILDSYCHRRRHGKLLFAPVDVVLSQIDVVQPDIIWISEKRLAIITSRNVVNAPDLVVEITGPFTRRKDMLIKRKLYEKHGVKEYWVIDPDQEWLRIYRRSGKKLSFRHTLKKDDSFHCPLFPGLMIELKDVFAH
jgi:Uma2 family endonuclease